MTLRAIKDRYQAIARELGVPATHVRFSTSPQHDGRAHVECCGDEFHYVVTERGSEHERRKTSDPEELLFWLISDLTFGMALDWEVQRRIQGEDSRRQLFRKDIELMSQVNQHWAERKKERYENILGEHPFDDRNANHELKHKRERHA